MHIALPPPNGRRAQAEAVRLTNPASCILPPPPPEQLAQPLRIVFFVPRDRRIPAQTEPPARVRPQMPVLLAQADVRRVLPLDALLLLPPVARPAYPSAALPARDPERGVCDEQNEDLPERPAAVDPEHRLRICGERAVGSVKERAVPRDGGRIQILLQYRLPREVEPRVEKRKGGGVDGRVREQDGKCNARAGEQEEDSRDVLR